jgi:hypothetical protein
MKIRTNRRATGDLRVGLQNIEGDGHAGRSTVGLTSMGPTALFLGWQVRNPASRPSLSTRRNRPFHEAASDGTGGSCRHRPAGHRGPRVSFWLAVSASAGTVSAGSPHTGSLERCAFQAGEPALTGWSVEVML